MQQLYFSIRPDITGEIRLFRIRIFSLLSIAIGSMILGYIYCQRYISYIKQEKSEKKHHKELIEQLKQYYLTNLSNLKGKTFIKYLIHYLETFIITGKYSSIDEVLTSLGLHKKEIENIHQLMYHKGQIDIQLEEKIRKLLTEFKFNSYTQ